MPFDNNNQIQLMDSDLYCPLCNNEYSSENMPRLLTACGHTYCHSCLDTMIIEGDNQYRLQCPEDSIVIYLKNNQITQFPKNIALIKLIEGKKNSNTSFKEESSLEITKIQKNQDSKGNDSEQEIINDIISSEKLSEQHEENSKKDHSNSQVGAKGSKSQKGDSKSKSKPSPKIEEQLCLVHQKPLEIVCMVEMQKICSNCAIFGQHKGHECKQIDEIQKQCDILHEDILNVYNGQEDIMKQWNSINTKEILEILEVNKRKIVKEVSDRYKKLREAIMKSEEDILAKIDQTCLILQDKIKATLKVDENVLKEYAKFQSESFGIIIKFEQSGLYEQKLRMLYDSATTNILFKGKDIISKIKIQHNNVFNEIEKIINSIKMEYNEEVFYSLEKFSNIKIQEEPNNPKEGKNVKFQAQDESLLESQVEEHVKPDFYSSQDVFGTSLPSTNNFSASFTESKAVTRTVQPKIQIKMESYPKSREPSNIYEELPPEKIERPPKKKLKSIKVPEKIQKILEALYTDTLDTLDLTNSELGDAVILQICQFLKGTRVRTVKFIRNKLSDDAVVKMIAAFGGVATLNLSQNYLTEQTLIHLANNRNSMPALRTVILSQNKIIERKHKEFIERLKKMDLNVST